MKEEKKLQYHSKKEFVEITPQMQRIINSTHAAFQKKAGFPFSKETGIVLNQYVKQLCTNRKPTMGKFADFLREKCHCVYTPSELEKILFDSSYGYLRLFRDSDPFVNWSKKAAELLLQAFQGNREAYDELSAHLATSAYRDNFLPGTQVRFLIIAFYSKYPWLDKYRDLDKLSGYESFVFFIRYLDSMLDAICSVYGFSPCTFLKKEIERQNKRREQRETQWQANNQRIDQLQSNLTQKDSMLQDLQDNFDNQLADSKVTALTDFFAQLNSDRYGNILDMVLQLRKGVAALSRSGYELPEELNGLFTLYHKLVQFIRDSHIDPIRKIGSQAIVHASDIEFCIYEGTPFTSEDETKLVETISPGWIYRDQNIQISRPKVKEVIVEESLQDDEIETEEALCMENPETVDAAAISRNEEVEAAEKALCPENDEITEAAEAVQKEKAEDEEGSCTENPETVEETETPQSSGAEGPEEELDIANAGADEKADTPQEGNGEALLSEEGTEPAEKSSVLPPSNETEAADQ